MRTAASLAIIALALASSTSAFAQTSSSALTRAEVRAQLIQAERDGIMPYSKVDYPPSAETIARNKELYKIRHPHDNSEATATAHQDTHDMSGVMN
ncbi:hypothetical protein BZM27_45875 [Paraburkholderia steynii]|uniref:DUF4148 domain-containing protein n=1 Tax=Paraburkholderia steynii TaxID=1245441 RepID=A0A4R0XAL8_9BURK|nr:hypothetical protein BZM27_45875 [Paraburkholderia steynii]